MKINRPATSAAFFLVVFVCVFAVYPQQGTGTGQGQGSGRPDIARTSDPATLVDELKKLLDESSRPGISDAWLREALKGKYFGNAASSVDSLFLVSAKLTRFVSGADSKDLKRGFQGHTFRLIPADEFPEPDPDGRGLGVGTGSGSPRAASREELLPAYRSDAIEKIWTGSTLRLKTIVAVTGYGRGSDTPPAPQAFPSRQIHYELAFRQSQPIPLVNVEDLVFSLAADDHIAIKGPGIVAWLPDETEGKSIEVVFAIKLTPPYLETEELVWTGDRQKDHRAIRHRIYADIAGIWIRDVASGEVVSKNIVNAQKLDGPGLSVIAPRTAAGALRILSKPSAPYTSLARSNGIMGTVMLRVTFLASGQIGLIEVIKALPDGLTEQAIAAARRIRFEPQVREGKPVTVIKRLEYSFNLY